MILRFTPALLALMLIFIAVPAAAATPTTKTLNSCLNIFTVGQRVGKPCIFNSDCPGRLVCHQNQCTTAEIAAQDSPATPDDQPQTTAPDDHDQNIHDHDDDGADAACGSDRRCRIRRLASQNKQRRHLHIAHQERRTQNQVNQILKRKNEHINRLNRPWAAAFQIHPVGAGILASRAINAHFFAEASLVYKDQSIYFTPDDPQNPSLEGYHQGLFGFGHITFLSSTGWFSPLFSAGFGMGRGSYNSYNYYGGSSSNNPTTTFHIITAAVGADAQFPGGFLLRLAFRHGRILYNQARYGPGVYDLGLKNSLRDYMNTQELWGVDFSIGWAF